MDPITLHFNVCQAGSPARTTFQVEDPRGTTILALKKQLFSDEIKACKSVRFIAAGKILDDATGLDKYKLGKEAHIHVSINDNAARAALSEPSSPGSPTSPSAAATGEASTSAESSSPNDSGARNMVAWAILAGVSAFIGTGVILYLAFQKRRQYTMHTSQLLFICAAIWVYGLFFHGLPALYQAINKLGSSSSAQKAATNAMSARSGGAAPVARAVIGDEAAGTTSSTPPSSPGLSLMTPTMPPGDATAASVLTQRVGH